MTSGEESMLVGMLPNLDGIVRLLNRSVLRFCEAI
jgi:hypothetical protein